MSKFFSIRFFNLEPYVPGEQPRDMQYIKLNTNESPFDVSPAALERAEQELRSSKLYPDPTYTKLREALAQTYGVATNQVIVGNGSDEILNYCFMAFCDRERPAVFPDITYGFYPVFAQVNCVPYATVALRDDFTVGVEDYLGPNGKGLGRTIFIANPNAPTGLSLAPRDIERIAKANQDRVVVVDEAYVDFGGQSCVGLVANNPNVLVVQTFSKSRSMAGARLGFAIGAPEVIQDLETIRNSTNPYNVNSWAVAMALGVLADDTTTRRNCATIAETREFTRAGLMELGLTVLPSCANFVFASAPGMSGREYYEALKERGILVRYLDGERTRDYVRITIGKQEDMQVLLATTADILEGNRS